MTESVEVEASRTENRGVGEAPEEGEEEEGEAAAIGGGVVEGGVEGEAGRTEEGPTEWQRRMKMVT